MLLAARIKAGSRTNDSIPLFNDYLVPRSKKFLMTCEEDLNSIPYLFSEPTKGDILNFRTKAKRLKKLARNRDLFVSGGWRSGGGVNGFLTIERGTKEEVEGAVSKAVSTSPTIQAR